MLASFLFYVLVFVLVVIFASIKVVQQYEKELFFFWVVLLVKKVRVCAGFGRFLKEWQKCL